MTIRPLIRVPAIVICGVLTFTAAGTPGLNSRYFKITVIDDQTGRGVPLVELRTQNNVRYYTDSNGIVAFHEPGLMNQTVFFHVRSHGYEYPKDGFGYRGKALKVTEGGSATLKIKRLNIAERLYRVTGEGIYRDSLLVGHPVPVRQPLLNAQVVGSDSVVNAIYKGKLYWFWGDTHRPGHPLGNFHVPGAVSELPNDGGLDPEKGIDLRYFLDGKGFAKETCRMPGQGPTWIGGLVTLKDSAENDRERLFAAYVKIKPPMRAYERGFVEWNDAKQQFEKVATFPLDASVYPIGHPFKHTEGGVDFVYFANPYPLVRVVADPVYFQNLAMYQAFSCLREGSRLNKPELDRQGGTLQWVWRKNALPVGPKEQAKLIRDGLMKPHEAFFQLQDVDTGKPITPSSGSVYWNAYRQRWVMITGQSFGTSMLGEVWYAEADTPVGPWVYARKIVTHDKYSFYNPKQHPYFDKENGRTIFFEGTYSDFLAGSPERTPRYDYNQVMYKLDLADERLAVPVPVYRMVHYKSKAGPPVFSQRLGAPGKDTASGSFVDFFAFDSSKPGTTPVYLNDHATFYGLRIDTKPAPPTTTPLYEFSGETGQKLYLTEGSEPPSGYRRSEKPLCLVWRRHK